MQPHELIESIHRLILDNLPPRVHRTPSGWISFNCPFCHERRQRAGVIMSGAKITFHCFNCAVKTGWQPGIRLGRKFVELAQTLGCTDDRIRVVQLNLLKFTDVLPEFTSTSAFSTTKFETIELPESTVPLENLDSNNPLVQYAQQRGILGLYPLFCVDQPQYRNRVVIPYFYQGDLVGWTARHINPLGRVPKYLHCLPGSGYVFNMDPFLTDHRKIVIVTEGTIDAIRIEGVAVLGNSLHAQQIAAINQLGKRVIVCPDRDRPGEELVSQVLELGWEVSYPPWENCKDASDAVDTYGRLLTVHSIVHYATTNRARIRVCGRILRKGTR